MVCTLPHMQCVSAEAQHQGLATSLQDENWAQANGWTATLAGPWLMTQQSACVCVCAHHVYPHTPPPAPRAPSLLPELLQCVCDHCILLRLALSNEVDLGLNMGTNLQPRREGGRVLAVCSLTMRACALGCACGHTSVDMMWMNEC